MAIRISIYAHDTDDERIADVTLPANKHTIIDAMDKAKIFGETFSHIMECEDFPELENIEFIEPPTLDELNFLAKRLEEISEDKEDITPIIAYRALLRKPLDTIGEAINRTYNLETVPVYPCKDLAEYGEIVLDNEFLEELKDVPDEVYDLLDPEKVGRVMAERENGVFIDGYYAIADSYEPVLEYDEELPESMEDWVFRLEITGVPAEDEDVSEKDFEVLTLPSTEEHMREIAGKFGEKYIEDCVWLELNSVIPCIDDEVVFSPENIGQLNDIARKFSDLPREDAVKFKGVLRREQPDNLDGVENILNSLDQYEAEISIKYYSEFGSKYLSKMLPLDFDRTLLKGACTAEFAQKIMCANNCIFNEYGVVSERGGHLYSMIEAPDREQISDFEMGGIS